MKKLLGLLLVFCGLSIHAEDRFNYVLKNDAKEPITFTLSFVVTNVRGKEYKKSMIKMNKWQKTIQPGKQEKVGHEELNDMNIMIQDKNGEIIIDNIRPEHHAIFTILPDYTLKISR